MTPTAAAATMTAIMTPIANHFMSLLLSAVTHHTTQQVVSALTVESDHGQYYSRTSASFTQQCNLEPAKGVDALWQGW